MLHSTSETSTQSVHFPTPMTISLEYYLHIHFPLFFNVILPSEEEKSI